MQLKDTTQNINLIPNIGFCFLVYLVLYVAEKTARFTIDIPTITLVKLSQSYNIFRREKHNYFVDVIKYSKREKATGWQTGKLKRLTPTLRTTH